MGFLIPSNNGNFRAADLKVVKNSESKMPPIKTPA
jgi:hypothetical protein